LPDFFFFWIIGELLLWQSRQVAKLGKLEKVCALKWG